MMTTAAADSICASAHSTGQLAAMSRRRDERTARFWSLHQGWQRQPSAQRWQAMMAQGVFDAGALAAKLAALGDGGQVIVAAGFTASDVIGFDAERCAKVELVH